mmetsp:Transcript_29071/g.21625  ORF Transcript_29071/g.21625 Transcript_29071/m.21625 type:complete len:97 (+) Transcript_29071:31-321(+)
MISSVVLVMFLCLSTPSLACYGNGWYCTSNNQCCSDTCSGDWYCGNTSMSWWAISLIVTACLIVCFLLIAIIASCQAKKKRQQLEYSNYNAAAVVY